jgi:hypothetical protein
MRRAPNGVSPNPAPDGNLHWQRQTALEDWPSYLGIDYNGVVRFHATMEQIRHEFKDTADPAYQEVSKDSVTATVRDSAFIRTWPVTCRSLTMGGGKTSRAVNRRQFIAATTSAGVGLALTGPT